MLRVWLGLHLNLNAKGVDVMSNADDKDAAVMEDARGGAPGSGEQRLFVHPELYNGDGAYKDYDTAQCIRFLNEGVYESIYIDRDREAFLSPDDRNNIVGSSPTGAFYLKPLYIM